MKNIVNKMRFALLLGFLTIGIVAWGQIAHDEKMSMSTLMFLDEMAGKITFDEPQPMLRGGEILLTDRKPHRPIASPDTINGKAYISAFIHVTGDEYITQLENMGVLIMCRFDGGIITANIPVTMIEEVAAIEGVSRIEVAELMDEDTDLTRQATNVDDVLTNSQDAQLAGLQQIYDGSGVILAVIDNGIDFQHIAFKDKNGNPRIKRAYKYDGSSATEWTGTGTLPTADATTTDHGTHTSSIAGGSSVIINGTNVTVTDDHANATYGGMAPGADLYLAGINGLNNTYIANAFQKISDYADAQGKPLVVSNSWSNNYGPRDGYYGGTVEQLIQNLFGESHPNKICLFASSNRAGNAKGNEGGGLYATGTASSSNPLGAILRCNYYSNTDCGYYYYGNLVDAWARTPNVPLACNIYVLNNNTGAILTTVTLTQPSGSSSTTVSGLSTYYNGTFTAYWATNSTTGKRQFRLYASGCRSQSIVTSSTPYTSNYTLAVEVYPTSGSSIIDMWGGSNCYYTNYLTTSGHTWTLGSDDVSVSDHAVLPEVISVGSYKTRDGYSSASIGDISPFSAYAVEGVGPLGTLQPWITAPGEVLISAYNHSRTDRSSDPLVNNATNPYGTAQGTSMATPAAAGIVALWLQAATECGKTLTLSEVKDIMAQTAIKDSWVTSGPNATHFGNGKINALAGIEYILAENGGPHIIASPQTVTFEGEPGNSYTKTVNISGLMLTDDIIAELNDPNGVYSINRSVNLGTGGELVITYHPTAVGSHTATITLTSNGADPVTITLNGTATIKSDVTVCDNGNADQYLPVYGYWFDAAQTNQMLYPDSKFTNSGMSGKTIKSITFYPTTGTYNSTSFSGINFYKNSSGNGTVTVKLANMPRGTTGYSATATRKDAQFTTVKTITMPTAAQTSLTEWVFDDLENDFVYEGGDLLIEVTTTVGKYGRTFFAGETQSDYTGYYSYNSTSTGVKFLPKVTFEWDADVEPITAGTVSPDALTFTDTHIGRSDSKTVTVTNTGNQPFTPVIDTSNLPSEFTVTGNGEVLPNGTLNLTVTYTPTDEGPHSGSFTVTIGDQTYTITVTGNGIVINSTLTSNTVMVPVYKTDIEVLTAYTITQLEEDVDHRLPADVTNADVNIKVSNDNAITRYDVYHKEDVKESEQNWATGDINRTVAYAAHNTNSYIPYAKDENDVTSWVQQTTIPFDGQAEEMWIHLNDYVEVQDANTWYVPVVVANGVVTTGNTYGAPIRPSYVGNMIATVNYDQSTVRTDEANNAQYLYMTAEVAMQCTAPQVEEGADYHYECFLARAWRQWTPYVVGVGAGEPTETFMGEVQLDGITAQAVIGCKDFQLVDNHWSLNEPTFCIPVGTTPLFISRFYYKRVPNSQSLNAGGGGGGGGGGAGAPGDGPLPPQNPTGINEFNVDKTSVSVTYVNTLGMTSSQPFDGVNIVITRYSDGSTSTTKVLR